MNDKPRDVHAQSVSEDGDNIILRFNSDAAYKIGPYQSDMLLLELLAKKAAREQPIE